MKACLLILIAAIAIYGSHCGIGAIGETFRTKKNLREIRVGSYEDILYGFKQLHRDWKKLWQVDRRSINVTNKSLPDKPQNSEWKAILSELKTSNVKMFIRKPEKEDFVEVNVLNRENIQTSEGVFNIEYDYIYNVPSTTTHLEKDEENQESELTHKVRVRVLFGSLCKRILEVNGTQSSDKTVMVIAESDYRQPRYSEPANAPVGSDSNFNVYIKLTNLGNWKMVQQVKAEEVLEKMKQGSFPVEISIVDLVDPTPEEMKAYDEKFTVK